MYFHFISNHNIALFKMREYKQQLSNNDLLIALRLWDSFSEFPV